MTNLKLTLLDIFKHIHVLLSELHLLIWELLIPHYKEFFVGISYILINLKDYKNYVLETTHAVNFCEQFLLRIHQDPNFLKKIIWTDERKFCQRGAFNRRNRHFWAHENPRIVVEVQNQIQFRINVFCLLMDNEVQYFMYDENLNSELYLRILREVVKSYLDDMPLNQHINR
jgi:hypothetical protein